MQTYGQIVQTYAQTMCKIMSEDPQISLMKSMEGMQRYARTYKLVGSSVRRRDLCMTSTSELAPVEARNQAGRFVTDPTALAR